MSTTRKRRTVEGGRAPDELPQVAWEHIDAPGAYLLLASGALARVPAEGVVRGLSPDVSMKPASSIIAAKLSDDPNAESSLLRELAAARNYPVAF